MNRNLSSQIKAADSAAKEARKAYNDAEKGVFKLATVNDNLTVPQQRTQQDNFGTLNNALTKRRTDVENLEKAAEKLRKKRNKMSSMLAALGRGGLSTVTDEDIMEFGELFADEELAGGETLAGEE